MFKRGGKKELHIVVMGLVPENPTWGFFINPNPKNIDDIVSYSTAKKLQQITSPLLMLRKSIAAVFFETEIDLIEADLKLPFCRAAFLSSIFRYIVHSE